MEPITVILLKKGNNDFNETLESINSINPKQILIGSFEPLKLKFKNALVVELKNNYNYSEALNELQSIAQTDWILYIKENETILQFNEHIPNLLIKSKEIYGLQILQDDVIVKESRLWNKKEHKIVFKNPIFEKPNMESTKIIDVILYQYKLKDNNQDQILNLWKKSFPLSADASYYKAYDELTKKNFKNFKKIINHYLFNIQKHDIPSVMARYYLSLVQGVVENDIKEAIQNIVLCIVENPLMAEFWCLLGDIFVKIEKFKDAIAFYENAIILGSRRQQLDFWPMHISKYEEYPKDMIDKCKKTLLNATKYESSNI
jgi:hypothetical protein